MKFCLLFNLSPCAGYCLLIGSQLTTWSQGNLHYIRLHFFQLDREFFCLLPSLTRRYSAAASPSERLRSDGSLAITIKMQYFVPNLNGWRMALIFTQPIKKLEVWRAKVIKISSDKKTYALKNMNFNPTLKRGDEFRMALVAYKVKKGIKPGKIIVLFRGGKVIPTLPTLPPVSEIYFCGI